MFINVKAIFKSLLKLIYVIIILKDVIKRIIMLYYYNYFNFLTEEKY